MILSMFTIMLGKSSLLAEGVNCPNPVTKWVGMPQIGSVFYRAMMLDPKGNLFAVGRFGGSNRDLDPTDGVDLHSGPSPSDLFVTRINADGTYAWSRVVGSDSNRAGIAIAPDGSVLVAADFEGIVDFDPGPGEDIRSATGFHESFLWRLSPDGDYLGTIVFGTSAPQTYGAFARALAVDGGGNVYVTGSFGGLVDFDPGETQDFHNIVGASFVTKFGPDGSYLWTRSFGSNQANGGEAIAVAPNGDVLVSGHFRGSVDFDPGPGQDVHVATIPGATYLTRLSPDGEQIWTRTWQILAQSNSAPFAIDSDGDIWVTGSYSNIFSNPVIDFDPTEGEDWQPAPSTDRIFVTRVTGDGNYGGTWLFSSSDRTRANDIAITPDGLIVLAGYFSGTGDFDPGSEVIERTSFGNWDAFVAAYDRSANPVWVRTFGTFTLDQASGIAKGPDTGLYFFGTIGYRTDLEIGCANDELGIKENMAQTYMMRLECVQPSADADGDGVVDLRDAAAFWNCFSDAGSPDAPVVCPQGCYGFDFDHDDDIDLDDLAVFLDHLSTP